MALKIPKVPRQVLNELRKELKLLLDQGNMTLATLLSQALVSKGKLYNYPLYIQDFNLLLGPGFLDSASFIGWRLLIPLDSDRHFAVDFTLLNEEGHYEFHSYKVIRHLGEVQRALQYFKMTKTYTLADLEIPGLNVNAFWLKPISKGNPDFLVPIEPAPGFLSPGVMYPASEFESLVHNYAQNNGCNQLLPPPTMLQSIDVNATYRLSNMFLGSDVCLDGVGANQQPAMKNANGSNLQKWKFSSIGNGYHHLTCLGLGSKWALEGGAPNGGAMMNPKKKQTGQMWRSIDLGNGYVFLTNLFTEQDNYAFEGGGLEGGALITLAGYSGQCWKLAVIP